MANKETDKDPTIYGSTLRDIDGSVIAVEFPLPTLTDDGKPTVQSFVIAADPVAGQELFDLATADHGDKQVVSNRGLILSEDQERNRSRFSYTGAYESNDPKASKWQPTGPKTPGKPRLN
jgi:hypothetical protein